jgi:hypothetical protein
MIDLDPEMASDELIARRLLGSNDGTYLSAAAAWTIEHLPTRFALA